MAWGVVSMCCGFAHSFAVMTVLRFLVGVCEAPFFPGALLILSRFASSCRVVQSFVWLMIRGCQLLHAQRDGNEDRYHVFRQQSF